MSAYRLGILILLLATAISPIACTRVTVGQGYYPSGILDVSVRDESGSLIPNSRIKARHNSKKRFAQIPFTSKVLESGQGQVELYGGKFGFRVRDYGWWKTTKYSGAYYGDCEVVISTPDGRERSIPYGEVISIENRQEELPELGEFRYRLDAVIEE